MKKGLLPSVVGTKKEYMEEGSVTCANGFHYNLLNFNKSYVDLDFIINSLSKMARFDGHNRCERAYTVGQHSVKMAECALIAHGDIQLAWDCLFHDSSEPYTGDVVKPLKNLLAGKGFSEIEASIEKVVFSVFGVEYPLNPLVKQMDINICSYEISTMLDGKDEMKWDIWSPAKTKEEFSKMIKRIEHLRIIANNQIELETCQK